MKRIIFFLVYTLVLCGCSCSETGRNTLGEAPDALVESCVINYVPLENGGQVSGVPTGYVHIVLRFSEEVNIDELNPGNIFFDNGINADYDVRYGEGHNVIILHLKNPLEYYTLYTLTVSKGKYMGVNMTESYRYRILTQLDPDSKKPYMTEEQLLTLVQKKTFGYFWDYAHPVSGLARERLGSGDVVTSGGSGFGVMTIPVAVERGFITRDDGALRMLKIVNFLNDRAERFHGAFPHWLDGTTGKAVAFSPKDNGGDLVETALLLQGLLTVRQYFDGSDPVETAVRNGISSIWRDVEWDWYMNGQNTLYWHWSPEYDWEMGMQINGWNEALIVYVLAASSPTHPITKEVYDNGWARNGAMANGKKYYGITLPLGPDYGGPLFFAQYSFLGLDPRGLSDRYADYWQQNLAQTRINHQYCVRNPKGWYGYGLNAWGLTASDIPGGYAASSPTEDLGTIAPTAALSSFPYTPTESMTALQYYYYILGDRLWGEYGFYDAFNIARQWFAQSYLAIDQGPIVIMIENYRSALLWRLFMRNTEILGGLAKLGFFYEQTLAS